MLLLELFLVCDEIGFLLALLHCEGLGRDNHVMLEDLREVCYHPPRLPTVLSIEAKVDAHLVCFPDAIDIYEALVNFIDTHCHVLCVLHVIFLPITQLTIRTSLIQVR